MIDDGSSVQSLNSKFEALDPDQYLDNAALDEEQSIRRLALLEYVGALVARLLLEVEHHIVEGVGVNSLHVRNLFQLNLEE